MSDACSASRSIRAAVLGIMLTLGAALPSSGQPPRPDAPWWKQEKIRFMWGQWAHARADKNQNFWGEQPRSASLPRKLFRDVALAGGTVFAEIRWCNLDHARFAHEFGMKYFATAFVCDLSPIGGRHWIKEAEEHWWPCPLLESTYEKWIVEPHLEGVKEG